MGAMPGFSGGTAGQMGGDGLSAICGVPPAWTALGWRPPTFGPRRAPWIGGGGPVPRIWSPDG